MTSPLIITTAGQNAILADAAGGAELVITHVAFGDANGAPYTPNVNQVALVNERYRAPVVASVAANGALTIDASLPATGVDALGRSPYDFWLHEAGVWGTSGGAAVLIGVAQMSGGYRPPPSGGQTIGANYRFMITCAAPGNISVTIDASANNTVATLLRAPWLTIDGVLNVAPGGPTVGATYLVGTAPTGAWANQTHKIAQWSGTAWVFAAAPIGHVVVDNTRAEGDALRYLRRSAAGWVGAMASTTIVGPTRLATQAEVLAGAAGVAMQPEQLTAWAGSRTFPASAHTHPIADVTNLQASLDGKVNRSGDTMTGALTAPTVTVAGTLTGATIMQATKQVLDHATDPRAASGSYLTGGSKDAGGLAVDVAALFPAGRRIAAGVIDGAYVAGGYTWPISGGTITARTLGSSACYIDLSFATAQPDLTYAVRGMANINGIGDVALTLSSKTTTGCRINFTAPGAAISSFSALFELYR